LILSASFHVSKSQQNRVAITLNFGSDNVEVGETVKMDDKGRVTLPVGIRKVVGNRAFRVELADKDTIVLRVLENRNELWRR